MSCVICSETLASTDESLEETWVCASGILHSDALVSNFYKMAYLADLGRSELFHPSTVDLRSLCAEARKLSCLRDIIMGKASYSDICVSCYNALNQSLSKACNKEEQTEFSIKSAKYGSDSSYGQTKQFLDKKKQISLLLNEHKSLARQISVEQNKMKNLLKTRSEVDNRYINQSTKRDEELDSIKQILFQIDSLERTNAFDQLFTLRTMTETVNSHEIRVVLVQNRFRLTHRPIAIKRIEISELNAGWIEFLYYVYICQTLACDNELLDEDSMICSIRATESGLAIITKNINEELSNNVQRLVRKQAQTWDINPSLCIEEEDDVIVVDLELYDACDDVSESILNSNKITAELFSFQMFRLAQSLDRRAEPIERLTSILLLASVLVSLSKCLNQDEELYMRIEADIELGWDTHASNDVFWLGFIQLLFDLFVNITNQLL